MGARLSSLAFAVRPPICSALTNLSDSSLSCSWHDSIVFGGRFDFFFSARGGGRGSPRHQEGGDRFFSENPTGGGGVSRMGRGREGVCGKLGNFFCWGGGGGGNFIFGPTKHF